MLNEFQEQKNWKIPEVLQKDDQMVSSHCRFIEGGFAV